jgi:diguanylate cyclase (GGDEF)-like protein
MVTFRKILRQFGKYLLIEINLKGEILNIYFNNTEYSVKKRTNIKDIFSVNDQKHISRNIRYKTNISNILKTNNNFGGKIVDIKISEIKKDKRYVLINFSSNFAHIGKAEREYIELLIRESETDHLTETFNRRGGWKRIEEMLKNKRIEKLGVLFIDIDGLKQINDGQGHVMGDKAILQIATLLKKTTRQRDVVMRYGGDEFLIVVEENSKERSASRGVAKRILKAVKTKRFLTTVSIGIHIVDIKSLVRGKVSTKKLKERWSDQLILADYAVYEAKEAGKTTYKTSSQFDKYFDK